MKTNYLYFLVLSVLGIIVINGCEHTPNELINPGYVNNPDDTLVIIPNPKSDCDSTRVYFKNDILPIFTTNCTMVGCHSSDPKDEKPMYNYNLIMKYAKGGLGSDLFQAITTNNLNDRMPRPPANKLDNATIDLIRRWINQGSLNDSCTAGCEPDKYAYAADIKNQIIKNYCGGLNNTCHFTGSAKVDISTYDALRIQGENKKLENAINHVNTSNPMPSAYSKLSSCDINKIMKWINTGYPK